MAINYRDQLSRSRRWVVKVGSSLVTDDGRGLNEALIASWARQISCLRQSGVEVVLVSSGAVAEGVKRMGWDRRPKKIHQLQAAAAVGQMGLIRAYESSFQEYQIQTAQILLTHDDLVDRRRYLNARSTLLSLLDMGVVPVVNENDTVAVDELRFGDNDTLAALVGNLVGADAVVLLTDQAGIYEEDPRKNPCAEFIHECAAGDSDLERMASGGVGEWGCGGMLTKVRAAEKAARSGALTLIASGCEEAVLQKIFAGESVGTLLFPAKEPLAARKCWMADHMQLKGRLIFDAGAVQVVCYAGGSLLSVGLIAVEGAFGRGDLVACCDVDGQEFARGLVNYAVDEVEKIKGVSVGNIENELGYIDEDELIHRDNLVLM